MFNICLSLMQVDVIKLSGMDNTIKDYFYQLKFQYFSWHKFVLDCNIKRLDQASFPLFSSII